VDCKALMIAGAALLLPPPAAAEPLQWRDGYVDAKGKSFKADWRSLKTDDGTDFVVDMKSVAPVDSSMRVVAYVVGGEEFDPNSLISFTFDCKGAVVDIASKVSFDWIMRHLVKQARDLACQ
jgi:hypothetical protein